MTPAIAPRHPGFHRRRTQRLQDEEARRGYLRQLRAFQAVASAAEQLARAALIQDLAREGAAALAIHHLH